MWEGSWTDPRPDFDTTQKCGVSPSNWTVVDGLIISIVIKEVMAFVNPLDLNG